VIIYDHLAPTAVIAAGVLAALAATGVGYGLFVKRDGPMWVMLLSRVCFFLLLGWCLLLPGEKRVETLEQRTRFLVLVDESRSMTMTPVKGVAS